VEIKKRRAVAIWLLIGVLMIIVQILLGGITRLTGSGLSITEWKPILGAVPPLTEADWIKAFDGYKKIAQFQYLNAHFTLEDFKFIYFWEWFHRFWARLLGVVFIIGFVYFLARKYFDRQMVLPFIILFLLGALQGFIGWIMVASGLNEEDLYVNHIKLAMHFIAALILLCYTLWFALKLLVPEEKRVANRTMHQATIAMIALLSIQLVYGAFMAGLKAAKSAPTWPLLNGAWVPGAFPHESWINNHFNVQFLHRQLAYLMSILIFFWLALANKASRKQTDTLLAKAKYFPVLLLLLQVGLGIVTVLQAPSMGTSRFGNYELLAEAHQLVAMCLLVSFIVCLYGVRRAKV